MQQAFNYSHFHLPCRRSDNPKGFLLSVWRTSSAFTQAKLGEKLKKIWTFDKNTRKAQS
jgi:hypothetical protein